MKKFLFLAALFCSISAYSQSLSVFSVDTSAFPIMKAKFFALDANGKQITNLSNSDFKVTENGAARTVLSVSCSSTETPANLSSVLVMDVSGSMSGDGIKIAQAAATTWINRISLGSSECAISTFDDKSYLNQDFTNSKTKLLNAVNSIAGGGGTDFDNAFLDSSTGCLSIAKLGKHKRIIVFLSDGLCSSEKSNQIISEAKADSVTIFCVTIGNTAPLCMKDYANKTGGLYFENIETYQDAEACYKLILLLATDINPCSTEWQSDVQCSTSKISTAINLLANNTKDSLNYELPSSSIASLKLYPSGIYFKNKAPGATYDTTIIVSALNSDFTVSNIVSSNPLFSISPKSFSLIKGESRTLTVTYSPIDSNNTFSNFNFETDFCSAQLFTIAGFSGRAYSTQTLKLTYPNGGELFSIGGDTVISWTGVLPSDTVKLEYSIDSGATWILLTDRATGLSWTWKNISKPESKNCLVRVSTPATYSTDPDSVPKIEWQKCLGGNGYDEAYSIQETSDGGYILACNSESNNGDVSGGHGNMDYWVVKLSRNGSIQWQKCLGGSSVDRNSSIQECVDGGYFVAGSTTSNDGEITNYHGAEDFWIVKLSKDGTFEWQKCLGGSYYDYITSIKATNDGGCIIAGSTSSNDGDVSNFHGDTDYWVVKLAVDGRLEWQKTYGGSGSDYAYSIETTSDSCYVIAGFTGSNDGDVPAASTYTDPWILKISQLGTVIWQKRIEYPGINGLQFISATSDGGFIAAGDNQCSSDSISCNGNSDFFVVKLLENGDVEWRKSIGGSNQDVAESIQETIEGDFIVVGYTASNDIDVSGNHGGSYDYWILKLSSLGEIQWQKCLGGTGRDMAHALTYSHDGSFVVAGFSDSHDGDVVGSYGLGDAWIVKFSGSVPRQTDISDSLFSIVAPSAASIAIDMRKEYINNKKDSVVAGFLHNNGSCTCRIDSIYITGANKDQFNVINRSYPYQLAVGANKNIEFEFAPSSVGVKNATVAVITQSDTLYTSITGEGIAPQLSVLSSLIDFGDVYVKEHKDTSTVLIENISSLPITINSLDMLGPDKTQFETLTTTPFTMSAGEKKEISLRFKPIYIGRTSGQIGFNFDGALETISAQLFGRGLGGLVYFADDSANAGETRKLALRLTNIKAEKMKESATNFSAKLRFNSRVLTLNNQSLNATIINDSTVLTILAPIPSADSVLYEFDVTACLGYSDITPLEITSFNWLDAGGAILDYETETENGRFKVLGICQEVGERLIIPNGKTKLLAINPNPSSDKLEIGYSLREDSFTEIYIINSQGARVMDITSQKMSSGDYKASADIQELSTGVYTLVLRTNADFVTERFVISK